MPDPRAPDTAPPTAPADPIRPGLLGLGPYAGLFGLLCVATFFEGFDTKLVSFVQPVIGQDFGASPEAIGTAVGISSFGMVLAFFVIQLADTLGRRPVFLGALFGYAVLTLATAFAPSLAVFTALQLFARMAMVVELFVAYLILSEEVPPEIRGRVNGIFGSTAALGAAFPAACLAPLEAVGLGWRGLFLVGSLPLLLFPLYLRRVEETRVFRARPPGEGAYGAAFVRGLRALWRSSDRGRLARVSLIWLAVNFWSGTALYFLTRYAYDDRGWDATNLQLLPWGTIPFGIAGYVLSGFVMDRFGRRTATTAYLIAAFAATVLCYRSTDDRLIYLGWFLLIGLGGVWTVVTTWTAELFATDHRATALGIANFLVGRMGLVFGPIVAPRLAAEVGSNSLAIQILAGVTLLILPVVWTLPETNGAELGEAPPPAGSAAGGVAATASDGASDG